jgi:hypothetical protein
MHYPQVGSQTPNGFISETRVGLIFGKSRTTFFGSQPQVLIG